MGETLINRFLHFANTVFPLEIDLIGRRNREIQNLPERQKSDRRLKCEVIPGNRKVIADPGGAPNAQEGQSKGLLAGKKKNGRHATRSRANENEITQRTSARRKARSIPNAPR